MPPGLQTLGVRHNQLNGAIPDFSAFANLSWLDLSGNHLSGSVPTALPGSVQYLLLFGNQLSGPIPDLSFLTNLWGLSLNSNQLTGTVPAWVCNASQLLDHAFNALTSADDSCVSIKDPNWAATQTVPPTNLLARRLSPTNMELAWTPILYVVNVGCYSAEVSVAP